MGDFRSDLPLGTDDPQVFFANVGNLDEAVTTRESETWVDRKGVTRQTWYGMEEAFQRFLINSGYQNIGDYGPGLEITARNQIFWRDGELYRAGAVLELPYTTTGDWGTEEGLFVAVGDQALRQQLADSTDPANGAGMVGYPVGGSVASYLDKTFHRVQNVSSLRTVSGRGADDGVYLVGHTVENVGGGLFYWIPGGTQPDDNGRYIAAPGGVWARNINGRLTPEMFGAGTDGSTDYTAEFENCFKAAIPDGLVVDIEAEYRIGSIDVSSIAGSVNINLTGKITRVDSSSDQPLISFGSKGTVKLYGGGFVDLNEAGQSAWADGVAIDSADHVHVQNIHFRNAKSTALTLRSREMYGIVENCTFYEGAIHSGVLGEQCIFLQARGGRNLSVLNNRFVQTADPLPNQSRQPAGFMLIDTGAPAGANTNTILVEGNYFENLGMHCAANIVAPLEFYSYTGNIFIKGNTFRKSRLTPIRTSSSTVVTIEGNNIVQAHDQIIDGGAPYVEAALVNISIIDRGYPSDNNDSHIAVLRANSMAVSGAVSCAGVRAGSGSSTGRYRKLTLDSNYIRAFPASSAQGVIVTRVQTIGLNNNTIEGFAQGVRVQQTNVSPLVSGGTALLSLSNNRFQDVSHTLWVRDDSENLHVTVTGDVGTAISTTPFTLRNITSAVLNGNKYTGGVGGDVLNIGAFWMTDNDTGSTNTPVGLASCPFSRLRGNKGIVDASVGT